VGYRSRASADLPCVSNANLPWKTLEIAPKGPDALFGKADLDWMFEAIDEFLMVTT